MWHIHGLRVEGGRGRRTTLFFFHMPSAEWCSNDRPGIMSCCMSGTAEPVASEVVECSSRPAPFLADSKEVILEDGSTFVGEMENGVPHGHGLWINPRGPYP